ncbi:MAG: hypothetical protein GY796_35185 [Chloroflexi bacterium]|nr:hypothetical protein [Chloroflexota bacterium]
MFDFLRNLTKSAEEKRQEALAAYLDNALSDRERRQFEVELAQDPGLQAELEQQRTLQQMLRQLPQRRVPRNFTLDPAKYGRPARQPLTPYYPALQAATVLTAVLFIFAIGMGVITSSTSRLAVAPAADIAMEPAMTQEVIGVEVTRVVTEMEEEAPAEEAEPIEEPAEEEMMVTEPEAEGEAESQAAVSVDEDEADEAADAAPAAGAPPEPLPTATLILLPTPTAASTATQSALPRPSATETSARAANTFTESETTATAEATSVSSGLVEPAATAVTVTQPEQEREGVERPLPPPLILVQMGLLFLFIILLAVTLYTRRKI